MHADCQRLADKVNCDASLLLDAEALRQAAKQNLTSSLAVAPENTAGVTTLDKHDSLVLTPTDPNIILKTEQQDQDAPPKKKIKFTPLNSSTVEDVKRESQAMRSYSSDCPIQDCSCRHDDRAKGRSRESLGS